MYLAKFIISDMSANKLKTMPYYNKLLKHILGLLTFNSRIRSNKNIVDTIGLPFKQKIVSGPMSISF